MVEGGKVNWDGWLCTAGVLFRRMGAGEAGGQEVSKGEKGGSGEGRENGRGHR